MIKDIFLFCCFTGLAYADVKKMTKEHIITGIDGEKWIKTKRTKTNTRSSIPLLPMASAILDKYANDIKCKAKNKLLPVLSNQKMNSYLFPVTIFKTSSRFNKVIEVSVENGNLVLNSKNPYDPAVFGLTTFCIVKTKFAPALMLPDGYICITLSRTEMALIDLLTPSTVSVTLPVPTPLKLKLFPPRL